MYSQSLLSQCNMSMQCVFCEKLLHKLVESIKLGINSKNVIRENIDFQQSIKEWIRGKFSQTKNFLIS